MDIGVPRRVIVVEPEPIDAPTPVAPMPDPEPMPAGPVRQEEPELVPAGSPA